MKSGMRLLRLIASASIVSATMSGYSFAETVTAVMHAPLRMLDPQITTLRISRAHGYMVYDTLLSLDEKQSIQPQMANVDVSSNQLVYSFTLREGLTWHDGEPVTAADCVASIRRWGQVDLGGRQLMERVEEIEITSDREFHIRLNRPFAPFLEMLAKPTPIPAFILPERHALTSADQPLTEVVGSGPFRFVEGEYRPGDRVVYERNEAYIPRGEPSSWTAGGKNTKIERVVWQSMPDTQTAINALLSGDIDYIEQLPVDLLPIVLSSPDIETGVVDALASQVTGIFNHRLYPFNNKEIRRAAILALDQASLMSTAIGNSEFFRLCPSIYGCTSSYASEIGGDIVSGSAEERMRRAKETLARSGYAKEPIVILQPSDLPLLSTQAIVAAERLREAGFIVDVRTMDWAALQSRKDSQAPSQEGGWDLYFTYWSVGALWDPFVHRIVGDANSAVSASGWASNAEMDELRRRFTEETSPEERTSLARAIQQIVYDDAIYYNAGEFLAVAAWNKRLDNIVVSPTTVFWSMTKE